jgi:SNF2 family DNA or RNA helicase
MDYPNSNTRLTTNIRIPLLSPYALRDYQQDAIKWMKDIESVIPVSINGLRGGYMCLTMGLGKTLIALSHCLSRSKGEFPTLIIASKTVLLEWKEQGIDKFFGDRVKCVWLHKDYMSKTELSLVSQDTIKSVDFVFTSYDTLTSINKKTKYYEDTLTYGDGLFEGKVIEINLRSQYKIDTSLKGLDVIYGIKWERVICDESQRFANHKTMLYKCIMAVYGKYKWCLSGTPIRNYESDIWAQMRFLGYTIIKTANKWNRHPNYFFEHDLNKSLYVMNYTHTDIVLPPKIDQRYLLDFQSDTEKDIYDLVYQKTINVYKQMLLNELSFACVLSWFIRLRQASIASYLLTPESKRKKIDYNDDDNNTYMDKSQIDFCHNKESLSGYGSTKISKIIEILKSIDPSEKVLIFSTFTSALDLLRDAIKYDNDMTDYSVLIMDGSNTQDERRSILDNFRNNPSTRALLLNYKVGSEGLNLTEACHCIFLEPWWTNSVHNQASSRIYRSGQIKSCTIHHIEINNTIEKNILDICARKDEIIKMFIDEDSNNINTNTNNASLDKVMLGRILGI